MADNILSIGFQDNSLDDDNPLVFGSDDDYELFYDSSKDALVTQDSAGNPLLDLPNAASNAGTSVDVPSSN